MEVAYLSKLFLDNIYVPEIETIASVWGGDIDMQSLATNQTNA